MDDSGEQKKETRGKVVVESSQSKHSCDSVFSQSEGFEPMVYLRDPFDILVKKIDALDEVTSVRVTRSRRF